MCVGGAIAMLRVSDLSSANTTPPLPREVGRGKISEWFPGNQKYCLMVNEAKRAVKIHFKILAIIIR